MMERIAEASPSSLARMAGVFYLLTGLTGGLAVFARGGLVVNVDAAATAAQYLGARAVISVWSAPCMRLMPRPYEALGGLISLEVS